MSSLFKNSIFDLNFNIFYLVWCRIISKESRMADSTPRVFLNNSKTPQDKEMTFCDFNYTRLRQISHTLTMLTVLRCCYDNLSFPVCHIIYWGWKMRKLLNVFQDSGLIMPKSGEGEVLLGSEIKFSKKLCMTSF